MGKLASGCVTIYFDEGSSVITNIELDGERIMDGDTIDLNKVSGICRFNVIAPDAYTTKNWNYEIKNLTVILPDNIKEIGKGLFKMSNWIDTVVWPSGCNTIEKEMFCRSSVSQVKNIECVTDIKESAFAYCFNLKRFTVPEGVDEIPARVFMSSGLEEICGLEHIKTLSEQAFKQCKMESIVLPSGVEKIPMECFAYCVSLKSLSGLENVTEVAEGALKGTGVRSLVFTDKLRTIGEAAFKHTPNLKDITLGRRVSYMGESVFEYSGIINLDWPCDLPLIPANTFRKCQSLSSVHNIDGVYGVEKNAFSETPALKSMDFSEGICSYIAENAFFMSGIEDFQSGYYLQNIDVTAFEGTKIYGSINRR